MYPEKRDVTPFQHRNNSSLRLEKYKLTAKGSFLFSQSCKNVPKKISRLIVDKINQKKGLSKNLDKIGKSTVVYVFSGSVDLNNRLLRHGNVRV